MASDMLRQSVEVAGHRRFTNTNPSKDWMSRSTMTTEEQDAALAAMEDGEQLIQENCDTVNPNGAASRSSSSKVVAPFLSKHIPDQYAPLSTQQTSITRLKDPNTKYCYRHQPGSKCRRTPNEPTMENLQTQLDTLSEVDRQAISEVWTVFSAAPAKLRSLMLQGMLANCCFPQLSFLSNSVKDLLKIDFVTALAPEISFKILSYLDTSSLCKAAQVNRRWRIMADDDVVWHKMCEQHIETTCTKCGWGLPLLYKKQLRDWKRERQLRAQGRGRNEWSPRLTPVPESAHDSVGEHSSSDGMSKGGKRSADVIMEGGQSSPSVAKRPCNADVKDKTARTRAWKDIFKERYLVGKNWKHGRCRTTVLEGHTNGVMCVQFDDNIIATGSYDCTIKIWDSETGILLRTLTGHTECVRAIQFEVSGLLISGSVDNTIRIWNWKTGDCVRVLNGHTGKVIGLHYVGAPRLLASGSEDKSIIVWNLDKKTNTVLRGHSDWVNSVRLDIESTTLFSASDDMTVRLWDLESKRAIQIFRGHVAPVQQVLLLPEDYKPAEIDADETEEESSRSSRSPTPYSDLYTNWPSNRSRPPRYILTGALDSTIRLWDVESGRCLKKFFGHVEGVWGIAADTIRIVSCAQDRMTKIWDAPTGKCVRTITAGHEGPITCIGLSDSRLVTGSDDCTVRVLDFSPDTFEIDETEED
ncbi:WD40-repeat-containing domain protein [Calycina marina]|uniref:WD40-repeat-containing domain protein n=1 Tax=Calycina marina TaxID=1763456 RepID=A0A9P7YZR9_9HELO|nr:WD40-repeat-containing domain protein [Calycina marina]